MIYYNKRRNVTVYLYYKNNKTTLTNARFFVRSLASDSSCEMLPRHIRSCPTITGTAVCVKKKLQDM